MNRSLILGLAVCLAATSGGPRPTQAAPQDVPPLEQPVAAPQPQPDAAANPQPAADPAPAPTVEPPPQLAAAGPEANAPVKPLTDGPLHEAFLSPAKDRDPEHIDKAPPPPIIERPGVDAPSPNAQWIEGYWAWYRVPAFWSDRKTDRIDFRTNGPPADHPPDEPGEAPVLDDISATENYT